MRIALVSSTLPPEGRGGAEAYVAELARSLAPRHDVAVLTGARRSELEGVEHIVLPVLAPVREGDSAAHRLLWHARDQWRPSVHVAMGRALARWHPDVVHTHEPQGLSAAVFTAIERAGLPHVHTAHDLNLLCVRTSMTRDGAPCGGGCLECRVQRTVRGGLVRRNLAALLAVSDFIRDRHVHAGVVAPERAHTLYLAAAPGPARLRRPEPGTLRLGFIGTLAAHKGVATLLDAFAGTPAGWSLTLAGSGPLEPRVRAAAAADARIAFAGHLGGAAKDAFFDGLDLLVIPSEWEEPGATVCFEAAIRGIPSVVSDRGGLPELPEVTVFGAGDALALREALERVGAEPATVEARSERLLSDPERYAWSTHARRVESVLADAAHLSPRTP
jgi:glycosyltransferase involved in cell wall biosynthesis